MNIILPIDIRAEALLNYFPKPQRSVVLCGPHKRSVYEDVLTISVDQDNHFNLSFARYGMYDILPECLFHPIDRFNGISANEYKERLKEEIEQQQAEEKSARDFFAKFDKFILELGSIVQQVKDYYSDQKILADIMSDSLSKDLLSNRFVRRMYRFLPLCKIIRGDKTFLTLMLRNTLYEEGLSLIPTCSEKLMTDFRPRYNTRLEFMDSDDENYFLGNEYEEEITEFIIDYWNEDECTESFLQFVSEIRVFEEFVNDFFVGIEDAVRFRISADAHSVRLADDICFNFLDYNTNL